MAAGRAGRRARPTRSSSPPARRAGWTASTSSTRDLAGRPLLAWSLAALAAAPEVERIVVVTSPERIDADRGAPAGCRPVGPAVVAGGERRQESVAAGLAALDRLGGGPASDDRVVLVHDGARPLVTAGARSRAVAAAAAEHGAAIPVVPVAETLKRVDGDVGRARPSTGPGWPPPRRRRASGATLLRAAFERFPPSGPRDLDRRGRPARGL